MHLKKLCACVCVCVYTHLYQVKFQQSVTETTESVVEGAGFKKKLRNGKGYH